MWSKINVGKISFLRSEVFRKRTLTRSSPLSNLFDNLYEVCPAMTQSILQSSKLISSYLSVEGKPEIGVSCQCMASSRRYVHVAYMYVHKARHQSGHWDGFP